MPVNASSAIGDPAIPGLILLASSAELAGELDH
jgi:hypothetical protein